MEQPTERGGSGPQAKRRRLAAEEDYEKLLVLCLAMLGAVGAVVGVLAMHSAVVAALAVVHRQQQDADDWDAPEYEYGAHERVRFHQKYVASVASAGGDWREGGFFFCFFLWRPFSRVFLRLPPTPSVSRLPLRVIAFWSGAGRLTWVLKPTRIA